MNHSDANGTENSSPSDNECPFLTEDTTAEMSAKTAAYLLAFLTSLLGNTLVITYVYRTRRRGSVARLLVSNMAAADLLVTMFNIPAKMYEILRGRTVPFGGLAGNVACKLLVFFQDVSIYCSILTLVAITLDQFFVITMPLKARITIKTARAAIALIWIGSVLAAAPVLHATRLVEGDWGDCEEVWSPPFDSEDASGSYTLILFIGLYAAPVLIMAVLYTCSIYTVWNRKSPDNSSETCARAHRKARHTTLRMFIAVVVTFTVCWLPLHVNGFLLSFDAHFRECGLSNHLWFLGFYLGHLNSTLNPCIYVAFNRSYRQGFKDILGSIFSVTTAE